MNALVSVCHFCELHGPKVVFSTQSFRNLGFFDSRVENNELSAPKSDRPWKYGNAIREDKGKTFPASVYETCAACRSIQNKKSSIVTDDDIEETSYVSSQFPLHIDLFTLARQACIRSLSCEVCSEREGPIYFGDNTRGHVISYTFFLKDTQARGFQKWYSILVLMRDRMFLLNSWSFLIENIQEIIQELQAGAEKVFSQEEEEKKQQQTCLIDAAAHKRQKETSTPRSLSVLVGNQEIWHKLHKHFSWILKAGGRRLEERMARGPLLEVPQFDLNNGISPSEFLDILGPDSLFKVLHHLYIGHEIILKSSNEKLLIALTKVLEVLLPPFLFRPCHNPTKVDSLLHSNILTVPLSSTGSSVEFPFYGLSLIFIPKEKLHKALPKTTSASTSLDKEFSVKVIEPIPLDSAKPPQLVTKVHRFFTEQSGSPPLLSLFISTIFEEWISKIKIWSYVDAIKENELNHQCPQGIFLTANEVCGRRRRSTPPSPRSVSPARGAVLSRSPSPSSSSCTLQQAPNLNSQMLLAVGAQECDVPLFEAWSKYYKLSKE